MEKINKFRVKIVRGRWRKRLITDDKPSIFSIVSVWSKYAFYAKNDTLRRESRNLRKWALIAAKPTDHHWNMPSYCLHSRERCHRNKYSWRLENLISSHSSVKVSLRKSLVWSLKITGRRIFQKTWEDPAARFANMYYFKTFVWQREIIIWWTMKPQINMKFLILWPFVTSITVTVIDNVVKASYYSLHASDTKSRRSEPLQCDTELIFSW